MDESITKRIHELSRRPGIDAVVYQEHGAEPVCLTEGGRLPEAIKLEPLSLAILALAKHMPDPTAIVSIGDYNIRIHTGPDLTVMVFLLCGHPTAKSLSRTLRRVVDGTRRSTSSSVMQDDAVGDAVV